MSWRVEFTQASNDQTIGIFDCEISLLSKYISKNGALSASIPIPNERVGSNLRGVIGGEGKVFMYVYYNGAVWWGGFLDATTVSGGLSGAQLDVAGVTFEAYPDRREARKDTTINNQEQTAIAKVLWDQMQGYGIGSSIGVDTTQAVQKATTKKRSIAWLRSDARTYGSILKEVSNRDDGFEWIIDVHDNGGNRHKTLTTGFPQIGRPESVAIFAYPGKIISYTVDGDATEGALSFQARGKAPDPVGKPNKANSTTAKGSDKTFPIMSAEYTDTKRLGQGYIRTDATIDRSNETSVSVLNDWAKAARATRSGPLVLPSITAYLDGMNQSILGSDVTVRISDFPYPKGPNGEPGFEGVARVIGYEINPGESGEKDVVKLVFENPYDQTHEEEAPN